MARVWLLTNNPIFKRNSMVASTQMNRISTSASSKSPTSLLAQAWRFSPLLTLVVGLHAALIFVGIAGLALDPRTILGAPLWAKTTKFALSITFYCTSLLWMLSQLKSHLRLARFIATGSGIMMLLEIGVITLQNIGRAVPAHYNVGTVFDMAMWNVMAISIMVFWVLNVIAAIFLLREKMPNRVLATAVRLSLFIAIIGMAVAFSMTAPNATQMAALQSGQKLALYGGHNVNALVDGQTRMIPFLGWNMDGGDLRIAHFIGLHAMQVLPLLAWWLLRRRNLSAGRQVALLWVAGGGYLGLTLLTLWQALRNQSIIAPDALTLVAFVGLIAIVVAGSVTVTGIGKTRPS